MQKNILLIAVAAILTVSAQAQQKIAYLNSSDVIQSMPEFKAMTTDLEKKQGEYKSMLEKMYSEYESKEKELQAMAQNNQNTQDAVFELKVKELQDLQTRIQTFQEKIQEQLQQRQTELMKPIQDKYLKTVRDIAKEQGYAYILDITSGAVAYFPEDSGDMTDAVLTKMGYKRLMNSNLGKTQNTSPAPAPASAKPAGSK